MFVFGFKHEGYLFEDDFVSEEISAGYLWVGFHVGIRWENVVSGSGGWGFG